MTQAGLASHDDPNRAYYLLGHLGLSGTENPTTLSGGESRRAALARASKLAGPKPIIASTTSTILVDDLSVDHRHIGLCDRRAGPVEDPSAGEYRPHLGSSRSLVQERRA